MNFQKDSKNLSDIYTQILVEGHSQLSEMARPANSFEDINMNQAYASALKKFKAMGVDNANTYTIWDFMFRQLPPFFQQFSEARKKASGTKQRLFVQQLIQKYPHEIDFNKWAQDINDETKIRAYLDRADKGNRHIGRVRADAQQFIDNLPRQQSIGPA